ncbi:MAG: hypothetical protein KatS3mg126_1185 [Lysobacteraceae bacterium]|nr:MAG: hypothetical protein KatS3mg126_1185 [Xanthomonadaceae bacterium]
MIEIPGYTVLGEIGRGGMATVYRARQILLDREVALKVMAPQLARDDTHAQRFLQEARMLAALNHPNIVQVFDIGKTAEGLHYFSMQLLPGGDFATRLREGMSEVELVRVLVAVAGALGFAHRRGYVHRDVTPANILFDAHDQPVLTDFGIARALASTSRITQAGLSIGTSHYMSPEQARGVEVDHRSDIYSLGVLVFEAVVGHPPYEGEDGFAVAFAHVHDPLPRVPEEVARWQPLIDRAMAKDPAERFADCDAFLAELARIAPEEYREATGAAAPPAAGAFPAAASAAGAGEAGGGPAPPPRPPRAGRRTQDGEAPPPRWVLAVLAGGALLCLILLVLGFLQWREPRRVAANPARQEARPAAKPSPPAPAPVQRAAATAPAAVDENEPAPAEEEPLAADPEADGDVASGLAHTVQDPVAQLLALAAANIRAQRYTTPPVTNALDRYRLVLQIEPGNKDALQGIARVASIYLDLARRTDPDQDPERWLDALGKAARVAVESPLAADIAAGAEKLRKARLEQLLGRARKALQDWDAPAAAAALEQAARIDPGSGEVARMRGELGRLGKPGWVFRDAQDLPEMVVVAPGLALSRNEITVADFRRYWVAAGRKRFGNQLPSCRNREVLALFSKRNFEDPDIPQDERHPVVCVSHAMAEAYAAHLAERTGKPYRLPKAAELAALPQGDPSRCTANVRDRAFARVYRGRGEYDCDDGHAATAPVRSFPAAGPGLFDLDGNVSEWTSDCADSRCSQRVVFGRSWELEAGREVRRGFAADAASNTIGLRLALELPARATQDP